MEKLVTFGKFALKVAVALIVINIIGSYIPFVKNLTQNPGGVIPLPGQQN